ncbi:MAG: 6-phosphogluconolactonase [Segetibacter sp.]|nr:6-phosphogluconolactonase [Segetibacter sp.]
MNTFHIYKNEKEVCKEMAQWITEVIGNTLKNQNSFYLALLGGKTAGHLYKALAEESKDKVDWSRVHFFWGDERVVPSTSEQSNTRLATEALLNPLQVPHENIHNIDTEGDPLTIAENYERELLRCFAGKETSFDLTLLGLEEDGHTLALFPYKEENFEKEALVIPVLNEADGSYRITLTTPVVNASAITAFLSTGKNKADALQHVMKGKYEPERFPAQLIQPSNKVLHWFLDEAVAAKLVKPIS